MNLGCPSTLCVIGENKQLFKVRFSVTSCGTIAAVVVTVRISILLSFSDTTVFSLSSFSSTGSVSVSSSSDDYVSLGIPLIGLRMFSLT